MDMGKENVDALWDTAMLVVSVCRRRINVLA